MRALAERAYFGLCLVLGRLLRAGRYSQARAVSQDSALSVRKSRRFYAPILVWLGDPLFRLLDTGVRVLPRREWVERERLLYRRLYDAPLRIDTDGTLVLPHLAGETLATLLENLQVDGATRQQAIERAVVALAAFHRLGFTHGDAMAENVLIDLAGGVARWFDFETVHAPHRPLAWRRADDLRALLATCLLRSAPEQHAAMLRLILGVYADEGVARLLATNVASVWRRPLTFHLGQAGLSLSCYREIGRLLSEIARTG